MSTTTASLISTLPCGRRGSPFYRANTYRVGPEGIHAFRPWTIIERAGLKIGIVGATTPGVTLWDAENIRGRLRFGDIVPAVRQAVQEVRGAGADIVLVTVHSGLDEPSSYDTVTTGVPSENVAARIAREVPGIDLVLYGHSHKEMRGTTIGQTLLIQPKNWATSVNIAHLTVSRVGGDWRVTAKRSDLVQAAGHAENPAVLAATERDSPRDGGVCHHTNRDHSRAVDRRLRARQGHAAD